VDLRLGDPKTVDIALGRGSGLSASFLPVTLGLVAVTVGFFWKQMLKAA
jgi:hypothetical protein